MRRNAEFYGKLFASTFYISAFTFGGGFVIIPLMKKKFVEEFHWLEEDEMMDMMAIAQSSPGAIAVNASIIIGWRLAGLPGVLISVLGTVLPPFLILSVISVGYTAFQDNRIVKYILRGMQAGVAAVIASVVFEMAGGVIHGKNPVSIAIMVLAFIASCVLQINVIYIILICGLLGVIRTLIEKRRETK